MRFEQLHRGSDISRALIVIPSHLLTVVLLSFLSAVLGCTSGKPSQDPVSAEIQNRFLSAGIDRKISVRGDSLSSPESVRKFYQGRAFRPVWSNETSRLPAVDSLLSAVKDAVREGLNPDDYSRASLDLVLSENPISQDGVQALPLSRRADLDLLLTDAFFLYALHLSEGKIDSDSLSPRYSVDSRTDKYIALLDQALRSTSIRQSLQALAPQHPLYSDLRELLSFFEAKTRRTVWPTVPQGPTLKGGDVGRRVFALKNRLWASGDLGSRSGGGSDEFDSTLVDAVRLFRLRHGLEPSGVVDSATIVALNVPVEKRIEQIKINLERWRWMPHDLGRKYIRINIPDFRLDVIDRGQEAMNMKVVLGLPAWQTPVFSAEITQVLFNSHWMAPEDIVEKELINYMKADSNYLRSNKMTLWHQSGDSLVELDPRTIDFQKMDEKSIDFRLRQDGGPQNIMGQVKFVMQNRFNVYLHDTPYREDFAKTIRMNSHGCIRLERPFDLASYVLEDFPEWTREQIDTVVARNVESSISLHRSLPVHVFYYTVWKGRDGSAQFREDFYGLDRRIGVALRLASDRQDQSKTVAVGSF